ncbi:signal recognition particle-docking protein FtsY [Companilactobacillus mishanensis]|uniref:Signal recognition particle receptor FtsY n=1 Tax=Companilactobacillus mishanensis TaxID=2486008 RepID=A0ABW9P5A5_9LACO|nr:signal recognition particle-docking protein FtsY [Companilactobacillus mishanensis]MQS44413.1 signal recognition particle-docking protein FtsY [Companilactobacillus mishanensis]
MGLFDRIKKAFTGKNDEEVKEEKDQQEVGQESKESDVESASEDIAKEESNDSEPATDNKETSSDESDVTETDESNASSADELNSEDSQDEDVSEASDSSVKENEEIDTSDESEEDVEEQSEESGSEETDSDSETAAEETDDVQEYDEGLKKSRTSFSDRFNKFLANFRSVDEDFFDDLEELLIESDVGYETAMRISDELREEVKLKNIKKRSEVSDVIVQKLVDMYDEEGKEEDNSLHFSQDKTPTVFLFVGVNGAGKTTTIGKLAHRYQAEDKKVLLAAGDTFRAGAIEQLQEWGRRVDVPVEAKAAQTDPASVVYDAVQRAIKEDFDILLVDTAGRLQNKQNLMRELEKIKRVITRELPESPQEVLLVLDGSTGQNALSQAKQFNETTDVSGIVLTKIDGSSQGGIVLAIRNELHIPVKLVGLGEQMDDLRDFDAEKFIYGLFKELIVGSGE